MRRVFHDANADVPCEFVSEQAVAIIDRAAENRAQAGQSELEGNQPPEVGRKRLLMRYESRYPVDDEACDRQNGERNQSSDNPKGYTGQRDGRAGVPDYPDYRREIF
jgi:hypothetical protein